MIFKKKRGRKTKGEHTEGAANDTENHPSDNAKRRRRWFRAALRVTPALTGIAMLAVIIAQAVIYNGQWRVMQEQLRLQGIALEQAKEIQRRSDRAWVAVHSVGLDRIVKPWENAFSTVNFVNAGKTPANNVRFEMWTGIDVPAKSFRELKRPTLAGMESQGVIPPVSVPDPQHIQTNVITEALAKSIEGGFMHVYVYGTIQYDDDAGHHSTDFCFEAREATVKTEYTACIDGNVAN